MLKIFCVTFIACGSEVGINKPWGQNIDPARKHLQFLNISFKNGSNFTLVSVSFSHEKPILFIKLVPGFEGMRDQSFIICTYRSLCVYLNNILFHTNYMVQNSLICNIVQDLTVIETLI